MLVRLQLNAAAPTAGFLKDANIRMSGFPIRVLAQLSGVSATSLRAWERRYGLLAPARTAKGHRLYSDKDLQLVRRINQFLEAGYPIGKAVAALQAGAAPDVQSVLPTSPWMTLRKRFLQAIERFDESRLDAIYNEALALYPIDRVSENLLQAVMRQLGERWRRRHAGIAEEHFFSAYLRNKIGARLHHIAERRNSPRVLLACLPGEQHELGLLLFALLLKTRGYRVLYLGADLPLPQMRLAAETAQVAAVVLSASTLPLTPALKGNLLKCANELDAPVMLGGPISERQQQEWERLGVTPLGSAHASAAERLEAVLPPYGAT